MLHYILEGLDAQSILLFLAVFLLIIDIVKNKNPKNFPPGPWGLPFVGNVFNIDTKHPHIYMGKLAENYGDVFSLRLGREKIVFVMGYQLVKDALVNQGDAFADRPCGPFADAVYGGLGLFLSNGYQWKKQRRFALSTLRDFGLGRKTLESVISDESRFLQEAIEEEQGKPFNPHLLLNCGISNIICSLVFGHRFHYSNNSFQRMLYMMSVIMHLEGSIWAQSAKDAAAGFHEENLVLCSLDLFIAGTETTTTSLLWALLYMIKYPDIQKKVQAEIDRVIGKERQPSMADRVYLPYTDAVIHETQRHGNTVPLNAPRMTNKDTTLGGHFLPKGTTIIANLTSVLFDKTEWQTPNTFNPGHFLDSEGKFVRREAFIPFSAGGRMCLGEQLARMELFLFFTFLLQKFTFTSTDGKQPSMEYKLGVVRNPLPFSICAVSR
ncbi:cytochrome P450 2J2-like isoform X2 [Lepisosteus oculatus]|uniref:cytochrome P450 2J2-like isoform X2 n=1 Tax=Lepisosteus oculatus TaxID=7918 RepID=UPI0037139E56